MPSQVVDKLLITNVAQLKKKYGVGGSRKVLAAIKKLITADAHRGIASKLVDLSDDHLHSTYGASSLGEEAHQEAKPNKEAIDQIYAHFEPRPAYVLLVGSTDVIPHVPLENPMEGDGDETVPSDLPYACDASVSTDIQDFIAPTRVVGRLPNVTNDTDPAYLISLLDTATHYTPRHPSDYSSFLGLSAQVWKTSTELSLNAIFSSTTGLKLAPPSSYKHTTAQAKKLVHFINCHGAASDPHFYGQRGSSYPIAHSADWMASKIVKGTVLIAECCYGAELYDPNGAMAAVPGQMGICNTYLGNQAYAYFGSSTIAYGPAAANDQADLICQYFCVNLINGASTGRSCLQARLNYVLTKGGVLTPTDLKTLAQFNLMADPSLTPVISTTHAVIPKGGTKSFTAEASVDRHTRWNRRMGLAAKSAAAAVTSFRLSKPTAAPFAAAAKGSAFAKLRKLAADHGIKAPDVVVSYSITPPAEPAGAKGMLGMAGIAGGGPKAVHTLFEKQKAPAKIPHLVLVKGVEAVEYSDGMDAQVFESR